MNYPIKNEVYIEDIEEIFNEISQLKRQLKEQEERIEKLEQEKIIQPTPNPNIIPPKYDVISEGYY